ncbi:MAG: hypothetical protein ACO3A4_04785 [Silvanigrellaceae bacterium]
MMRFRKSIYSIVAVLVSCGPADEYNLKAQSTNTSSSSSSDASTANGTSTVLKSKGSVTSTIVQGQSSEVASSVSFSLAEINLHQGMSSEVEVTVNGKTPNGTLALTQPTVAGLKVEFLSSSGEAVADSIPLDSQGKGKFKVRVSSVVERTAAKIAAPGPMNGSLSISASDAGTPLQGSVPVKVSNIAYVVMSGVTAVKDLPAVVEFPAGTIPVIFNPPSSAVAGVLHFGGGGAGDAAFRHQSTTGSMPANSGYCPLNKDTKTLVSYGAAISPNCLPCPSNAAANTEGTFYNHNTENAGLARRIVCKM